MIYLIMATIVVISLLMTGYMRRYALAKNLMDIPNHRSSHQVPTPRGGGVAFIIAFFIAIPCMAYLGFLSMPVELALVASGLSVAILGFIDDKTQLSPQIRILGHLSASIFALYSLGGMPSISFWGWVLYPGLLLNSLAVLYLVWLLNLYNFMDGIDGLAACEAISVCLGGAILYGLNGDYLLIALPLALAAAVCGFLYWNFPPARIFMGDAGSGFLGISLGILSIQAASIKAELFFSWLILLGIFIVDATVTLFFRIYRRCRIQEAHREHAYQHAALRFGRHLWVTLSVVMLNVCWLLPLAVLVGRGYLGASTGLAIAYLPLIILAICFKAGRV